MHIVYEGAIFEMLPVGGIARYFCELINRLPSDFSPALLAPEETPTALSNPQLELHSVRTQPSFRLLRRFWRRRQHRTIENRLRGLQADLIHWTYYTGLCRRPFQRDHAASVVTVYDFIHESFPDLDPSGAHSAWKRQAIESADHICCVSQTTFNELCSRFPAAASRASVTMLGNSFVDIAAKPVERRLQNRPYILFVGRRDHYKNFHVLWDAFQAICSTLPELALVMVGPPIKRREAIRLGIKGNGDGVIHLGNVDDPTLKGLYQKCHAFVFPSMEEGFGLPALEALESGAPVIASTAPSLREVIGQAGHYFDPDDVDSLADLLTLAAMENLPDYEYKVWLGRKRASELTWGKTIQATAEVYQNLRPGTARARIA